MATARKDAKMARAAARAGRPAEEGIREPSGRLSRSAKRELGPDSVNEIVRMRAAALAGMRDPIWGTQLGRLFLTSKITAQQFRAGRQWCEVVDRWRKVHCGPSFNPKSGMASLHRVSGCGVKLGDVLDDTRDRAVTALVDEVLTGFDRGAADPALLAMRECCEMDFVPVGYGGMLLLTDGLSRLAEIWGEEKTG